MKTGNLSSYIRKWAKTHPQKAAFLHPDRISFSELDQKIDSCAHNLKKSGLQEGMKAILLVKADLRFYVLVLALFRMGVVIVLIDPGVGRKVMKNSLREVEADAFIGMPLAHIFRILYYRSFKNIPLLYTMGPRLFWGGHPIAPLKSSNMGSYTEVPVQATDVGGIFFTSGSTGPPKGVLYQNGQFHAQIQLFSSHYQWNEKEIDLCTFPLIGLFSLCLGCSVVLADMDPTHPARLRPKKLWRNLQEHQCTHMFASPMVLRKITAYASPSKARLSHLKRIVSAGAPVPVSLLREVLVLLPPHAEIHTPYGATEALPVSDAHASELIDLHNSNHSQDGVCVGKPIGETKVSIVKISEEELNEDDLLSDLDTGEIGEIVVSGPLVTQSYLASEAVNRMAKIFDKQGILWHRMGDLGKKDTEGRIWFYGRKNHRVELDDRVLFTIPVEARFNRHPLVKRTALVGIPGNRGVSVPVLIVETKRWLSPWNRKRLQEELKVMAVSDRMTEPIQHFLVKSKFPVDPRHNAKIFREKLSQWAQKRIK